MKRKKGQALIEFLLLLPVIVFLIFSMIDVGKMVIFRTQLENEVDHVVSSYQEYKTMERVQEALGKDIILEYQNKDGNLQILLKKEISYLTPGLSLILPNFVSSERSVPL